MINGKKHAWEDITIFLPGGPVVDVINIEYSDKRNIEGVYGKGASPIGYGRGNYEAEASITIKREALDYLNAWLALQNKGIYDLDPFPITVVYAMEGDVPHVDKLKGCKFVERKFKGAQGDTSLDVELPLYVQEIISDGVKPMGGIFDLH